MCMMIINIPVNLREDRKKVFKVPNYWSLESRDSRINTRELVVGTKLTDYVELPLTFSYELEEAKRGFKKSAKTIVLRLNPKKVENDWLPVAAWPGMSIYAHVEA